VTATEQATATPDTAETSRELAHPNARVLADPNPQPIRPPLKG